MDSINDLIWKEEDENDIMQARALINSGVGMIQTCQISMSSCSNESGTTFPGEGVFTFKGC